MASRVPEVAGRKCGRSAFKDVLQFQHPHAYLEPYNLSILAYEHTATVDIINC